MKKWGEVKSGNPKSNDSLPTAFNMLARRRKSHGTVSHAHRTDVLADVFGDFSARVVEDASLTIVRDSSTHRDDTGGGRHFRVSPVVCG
jgi:hypothetical protein